MPKSLPKSVRKRMNSKEKSPRIAAHLVGVLLRYVGLIVTKKVVTEILFLS